MKWRRHKPLPPRAVEFKDCVALSGCAIEHMVVEKDATVVLVQDNHIAQLTALHGLTLTTVDKANVRTRTG
jgi:hypothetical protein